MSLSTSSSESSSGSDPAGRWRRFFRLAAGSAAVAVAVLYAFVVLVDPWATLPLILPLDRTPVTTNQRFSYPALARSAAFDSAIFGTSTSRLLRPAALDPAFDARFANLAMNDATPYEMSRLIDVFAKAHPAAKMVLLGVDSPWCATGESYQKLTSRPFPEWMYQPNMWHGYSEMFNLFAVQEAAKAFAVLAGLKRPEMGRDGYTRFVPPDDQYDAARAAVHLREGTPRVPGGERAGAQAGWRFPALETMNGDLAALPPTTRKLLFFVPYNYRLLSSPGSDGAAVWDECKRRVVQLAQTVPNVTVIDFMRPSPITTADDNYWDPLHYRTGVADQVVRDLVAADHGEASPDYRLMAGSGG
jgi:hypothetical protein